MAIPAFVFFAAVSGSLVTQSGMDWYRTLSLPWWTPPGSVIGAVWTVIYVLSSVAAIEWWSAKKRGRRFGLVAAMFVANLFLNVGWSVVFFGLHEFAASIVVASLLALSTWSLVALMWTRKPTASVLLLPYAAWATFATCLTAAVARQNGFGFPDLPAGFWLFVHLAGFIVGLGSVTVIDLLGFLGRESCYWTETTIRAHKVTKPLIWIGMAGAIVGGALWHGSWTPVSVAQAWIALVLLMNGYFLSFVVSPFLLARESLGCSKELIPTWMQRRIVISFLISFVGWWSALALTVMALVQ